MGREVFRRPLFAPEMTERTSLTSTDAGSTLVAGTLNIIDAASTAGSNIFVVPEPRVVGDYLGVYCNVETTDAVDLVRASTAALFTGTTFNGIRCSTGAQPRSVFLVADSTTTWATVSRSSGVTLIGTTASTG